MKDLIADIGDLNPTQQKQYNDKLFLFYGRMVPTIGAIEDKLSQCHLMEDEALRIKCKGINPYLIVASLIVALFTATQLEHIIRNDTIIACMYFALIALAIFVPNIIFKKYKAQKYAEIKKREQFYRDEVENMVSDLGDRMRFIPHGYCTSNALNYFYQEYHRGKVRNLREAMCSYDEYSHRLNMEQGQMRLYQQQQKMIRQNNQIMYNQEMLQQELRFDTAMIMLASFL